MVQSTACGDMARAIDIDYRYITRAIGMPMCECARPTWSRRELGGSKRSGGSVGLEAAAEASLTWFSAWFSEKPRSS